MKIKMESGERIRVDMPDGAGNGAVAVYDDRGRVIMSITFENQCITTIDMRAIPVGLP